MDSIRELNMYKHLETVFIDVARRLRDELSDCENPVKFMTLNLEAEGRVLEGELKITFMLSDGSYGSTARTEGGNLERVVREFVHRFDWKEKNAPLCLPKVKEDTDVEDEVPF